MVTAFLNTPAVETWDTWFRWREKGQLRDLTIDATWERVAGCLTAATPGAGRSEYARRLLDAFASWSLLLDWRIMATAGTPTANWGADDLVAVLNIARFVRSPGHPHASIDGAALEESASLAVYALDDGAMIGAREVGSGFAGVFSGRGHRLGIGIMGFADALALLGVSYESVQAHAHARQVAQWLANGCLAGSIALSRDRGLRVACGGRWKQRALLRQYPLELVDSAKRYGLRHARLTAITSQQRLAVFANGVADATDPLPSDMTATRSRRTMPRRVPAGAGRFTDQHGSDVRGDISHSSVAAQLHIRSAMQPWIDRPISYAVVDAGKPDASTIKDWQKLARKLHLVPLVLPE